MRNLRPTAGVIAGLIVLALAPSTVQADHCEVLVSIRSGPEVGSSGTSRAGCVHEAAHMDTNSIFPGATEAWASVSLSDSADQPTQGTMTVGSTTVTLTWTLVDLVYTQRWDSQVVDIGASGAVHAEATINGQKHSVTYQRLM